MNNNEIVTVLKAFCQAWLRCSYPVILDEFTLRKYANLIQSRTSLPIIGY
jgi:hypothetical protein